eukprot:3525924-Rhodomonas_salina.1
MAGFSPPLPPRWQALASIPFLLALFCQDPALPPQCSAFDSVSSSASVPPLPLPLPLPPPLPPHPPPLPPHHHHLPPPQARAQLGVSVQPLILTWADSAPRHPGLHYVDSNRHTVTRARSIFKFGSVDWKVFGAVLVDSDSGSPGTVTVTVTVPVARRVRVTVTVASA